MPRHRKKAIDTTLLVATLLLLTAGLFILASASFVKGTNRFEEPFHFIQRQGIGAVIGLIALFIASYIPYLLWKRLSVPLLMLSIIMLVLLFIPAFGEDFGTGATRWLKFGPISFQPAEILKLTLIVYLAAWLDSKQRQLNFFSRGFLSYMFIILFVGFFLILQPDLSTFAILLVSAFIMYFAAGGKISHIGYAIIIALIGVGSIIYITGYNTDRLFVFLNPENDPTGSGYQIRQAYIAIASGGLFGQGFGKSVQKLRNLPEAIGDSIFAVYSEEVGLIGNVILIGLFIFFLQRCFTVSIRAPDRFGKLLGIGITALLFAEIVLNMAAFTGLFPITGSPLPFISYGGTALISSLGSVGILFNISRYNV